MIDQLIESEAWVRELPDQAFISRIEGMFNAQNFFFCFYYMKNYVDFEGSSDRGRWYMQSVFVNLAFATFRWIKGGKLKGEPRERLLTAYDACALNPAHDEITIDDFTQLTKRYRNEKKRKKRDFSQVNKEFVRFGEMPEKTTPRGPADKRAIPLSSDKDDEGEEEEEEREETDTRGRPRCRTGGDGVSDTDDIVDEPVSRNLRRRPTR
jgi:hypothetical protein